MPGDLWSLMLRLLQKPSQSSIAGKVLSDCSHEQIQVAKEHGILHGRYEAQTVYDAMYGMVDVVERDGHFYRLLPGGVGETLEEVDAEEVERWKIDFEAFYSAIAAINGFEGELRKLENDIWRIGVYESPTDIRREVVLVPAKSCKMLDLALINAQRTLQERPLVALLAAPHDLPGAAVEDLSKRSIELIDLTDKLCEDLTIDFGEPRAAEAEAELVIDHGAQTVLYQGCEVKLSPQPFKLLLYLAQQRPGKFVHWTEAGKAVWGDDRSDGQATMNQNVHKIRDRLWATAQANQLDLEAVERLIENKPRVGYRLTICPGKVVIR